MAKKKTNKQPWSSPLESREALYKGVNPSADFDPLSIATQTVGYLGGFRTGYGMPEDEARWAAYLGLPYDKTYAPDTKIRFEGDENYPDRQYQGLSKRAKDEVRKKIIPQAKRIKDKYNKEWIQVLDTKPNSEYNDATIYHDRQNYLGDLGKFGIREVGESGIYEVGDKYDFPALIPIPDRNEGTELMVRDTIWSDRANPKLYNQEVIKRKNKYSLGSWFKGATGDIKNWNEGITNKLMGSNFGQGLSNLGIKAGGLGGIANTAATAIGGALAGGRTTGVGNALQGIGSLASNIPGVGGLIGAGVNLIGGLTNAAFGSKLNAENIAAVEGDIKQALSFTSNASDYDALASNYAGLQGVMGFDKGFIGKDGWLGGSKAKRKYNELKRRAEEAEQFQFNTLTNNAQNIADTNLQLLEANYSAYGGPIDMKYTGVMSPFGNQFKDGGIYIKPSKRGTFTAAAKKRGMGVQEFASKVLANKEDYSPAMVKKANFARNASKWKHDDGGPLDTRMELLRRLEEKRNRRGTYGGGEFGGAGASSLFLESPDEYTLVKDTIWVPYRETFNDAFGRARAAGLEEFIFDNKAYTTELGDNPDNNRAGKERAIEGLLPVERTRQVKNKKAEGGNLFTNGVTFINNGDTHENNPLEGVRIGVDENNIPNLVEEGEVIYDDYVFSNRLRVPKEVRQKYKLRGVTFADAAKQLQKESEERPNDPISKNGLEASMQMLTNEQEMVRAKKNRNKYANGGRLANKFYDAGPMDIIDTPYSPYSRSDGDYSKWFTLDPNNASKVTSYSDAYKNLIFTADMAEAYAKNNPNDESLKSFLSRGNKLENLTDEDVQKGSLDTNFGWLHKARAEAAKSLDYIDESKLPTREEIISNLDRLTGTNTPILDRNNTKVKDIPIVIEDKSTDAEPLPTANDVSSMKTHWLRYAPIAGHAIGAFSDLFSSPDYSAANAIEAVDVTPATVGYTPVGNYLSYKPFDRDYYLNKLNADATATRRAVTNTSGGNRAAAMAGLLAADYNYGNQLGTLARQAEEYNQALRERVEGFNRQTNLANAEMGLKAAMANAESRNQATKLRLSQAGQAAAMRKAAKDAYDTRRSNNINVLLEELGGLGTENWNRDWLDRLAKAGVLKIDSKGNPVISSAKGGNIRTKKKKGFTYG